MGWNGSVQDKVEAAQRVAKSAQGAERHMARDPQLYRRAGTSDRALQQTKRTESCRLQPEPRAQLRDPAQHLRRKRATQGVAVVLGSPTEVEVMTTHLQFG